MDKYFERNKYASNDYLDLHHTLTMAFDIVASNLFFQEAKDHLESPEHRLKLAESAFNLIAACEAIIDLVSEGEREEAFMHVKDGLCPIDVDAELFDLLIKALLK